MSANGSAAEAEHEETLAFKIVKTVGDFGINGSHLLGSAADAANDFRNSNAYADIDECVDGLINWHSAYAFSAGFVTGLGGLLTLPVSIPSGLAATWVIQARMAGAIAAVYGHDITKERVRTFATLCLLGDSATQALKAVGVNVAQKGGMALLERLPGKILIEINKRVGFRLLTKGGETGAINLFKLVPFVVGPISGTFDWAATRSVGRIAKDIFRPLEKPKRKKAKDKKPLKAKNLLRVACK